MKSTAFAMFIVLIALSGCKTVKIDSTNIDNNGRLLLSLERTGCFGHCPIYQIKIFYNGFLYYDAAKFTEHDGKYYSVLDKKELSNLVSLANAAGLFEMSDKYPEVGRPPADLSSCKITYQSKGHIKNIVDYGVQHPDALVKFEKQIDEILKRQKLQSYDK